MLRLTANVDHTLLIVDDSLDLGKNDYFIELFCLYSHHQNMTILVSTQDLHAGANFPTIFKNAHVWIIMGGFQNVAALMKIGRIIGNYKLLKKLFHSISEVPYNHLIIMNHPKSDPRLRYISGLFDPQSPPKVYLPME